MKFVSAPRRRVAASLLVAMCSITACGSGADSSATSSSATSSSATSSSSSSVRPVASGAVDDSAPPVAALSTSALAEKLDAAVATRDACAVFDVVRTAVPDLGRPAAVGGFYRSIADHLRAAERFVPAPIATAWNTATDAAAEEARRGGIAGVAFDSGKVRRALDTLDAACPPK